ncbi:MAG: hypothetical protein V1779_13030 [bacterium]
MKKLIATLIFFISPLLSNSGDLKFYKEDLNFTVEGEHFVVDANYYFSNLGHNVVTQNLLYQFPYTDMGKVDSFFVYDLVNNSEIPKRIIDRFGTFYININPLSSGKFRVYYRQRITSDYCKYIFKSTQTWNRPTDSSNFQLKLKKDIKIDSLTYKIDSSIVMDDYNIYYWEFKDFTPKKDFEFKILKSGTK